MTLQIKTPVLILFLILLASVLLKSNDASGKPAAKPEPTPPKPPPIRPASSPKPTPVETVATEPAITIIGERPKRTTRWKTAEEQIADWNRELVDSCRTGIERVRVAQAAR